MRTKVDLDQETHALEVCRLAYSDMRDVAEWNAETGMRVKDSTTIPEAAARAIQKVTSRTRTRVVQQDGQSYPETVVETEVALHPKYQALDLLARMYDKGQTLRVELEAKLRAIAAVAVKFVPEAAMAQYLAEVRIALGDIANGLPEAEPVQAFALSAEEE